MTSQLIVLPHTYTYHTYTHHTHTHTPHIHTYTHTCACTHYTPHIHTYTYTHTTYTHIHTGLRITTQNGFMNGVTEEGHTDADVYPDGPLTSGTHSLRRIKTTTQTARMMTRVGRLSVHPSVCMSICLFICLSVSPFLTSFYQSISLSTLLIHLSICALRSGGRKGKGKRFVSDESPQNFQVN